MFTAKAKKVLLENRNVRITLNEYNLYDLEVKTYYQDLCQELLYLHHIERKYKKLKAELHKAKKRNRKRLL